MFGDLRVEKSLDTHLGLEFLWHDNSLGRLLVYLLLVYSMS